VPGTEIPVDIGSKFDKSKPTYVASSNTKNDNPLMFPLLTTMTPDGKTEGLTKAMAYDDSVLFKSHDLFSLEKQKTVFPNGLLTLGKEFPWTIEVGTVNDDFANIKVTYTA
jgi:hypothetical protein